MDKVWSDGKGGVMAFELVIKNGSVVDGSGMARFRADVGVTDGRITEIGRIWAQAVTLSMRKLVKINCFS